MLVKIKNIRLNFQYFSKRDYEMSSTYIYVYRKILNNGHLENGEIAHYSKVYSIEKIPEIKKLLKEIDWRNWLSD